MLDRYGGLLVPTVIADFSDGLAPRALKPERCHVGRHAKPSVASLEVVMSAKKSAKRTVRKAVKKAPKRATARVSKTVGKKGAPKSKRGAKKRAKRPAKKGRPHSAPAGKPRRLPAPTKIVAAVTPSRGEGDPKTGGAGP